CYHCFRKRTNSTDFHDNLNDCWWHDSFSFSNWIIKRIPESTCCRHYFRAVIFNIDSPRRHPCHLRIFENHRGGVEEVKGKKRNEPRGRNNQPGKLRMKGCTNRNGTRASFTREE